MGAKVDINVSQLGLNVKTGKLSKARENAATESQLVFVFVWPVIGLEHRASSLDQSQTKIKRKQSNLRLLSTQLKLV